MTVQTMITLPSGAVVTVADYVQIWRELKVTDNRFYVCSFFRTIEHPAACLAEIRRSLHERISWQMPHYGAGQKWRWPRDDSRWRQIVLEKGRIVRNVEWHRQALRDRLLALASAPSTDQPDKAMRRFPEMLGISLDDIEERILVTRKDKP